MTLLVLATLAAVVALLIAEATNRRLAIWIAKPLASTGFVAVAVTAGGFDALKSSAAGNLYGQLVLLGLVLSWWGDLFLIPVGRPRIFQLGIASFLLAHVAYAVAFASIGLQTAATLLAASLLVVAAVAVLRWLRPYLPEDMRIPVLAYVVAISCMLAGAVGAVAEARRPLILLGATMFYLSDLAVARDRFVAAGFDNRLWGLPLYYGAQLVLASTIGG